MKTRTTNGSVPKLAAWLTGAALLAGCDSESIIGRVDAGGIDAPDAVVAVDAGTPTDAGPSCGATQTVCNGQCVNALTDNANCGACGRACAAGQVCSLGACGTTCAASLTTCTGGGAGGDAGAGAFCADLANDRLHCGACGNACPGGSICVARACVVSCAAGQVQCGAACFDLATDNANCGACGRACAAGTTCTAGACAVSCGAGLAQCDGTCLNLQTDNANCGACGTVCSAGQVCSAGACGATCAAPLATCAGAAGSLCANTDIDPAHCGDCATACALPNAAANGCTDGACNVVRCAANYGDCDGAGANGCETDTRTALAHCGACGRACALPHATSSCAAGACAVAACATGYADCDGDPANGCEVNTATENANCGACGTACPAGRVCSAGACGTTCAAPLATCAAAGGSYCTSTQNDPANCGACNAACALANAAVQSCAGGQCAVARCAAGFGDCDAAAANGCETDLATSAPDCGACGRACSLPNATPSCAAGACAVQSCATNYRDCDGAAADGCEVALQTDAANCGACGHACSTGQVCSAGVCTAACASPLATCGTAPAQYCANTAVDPANCGACGFACSLPGAAATSCAAGACAVLRCNASAGDCDGVAANGCEANLATSAPNCGACGRACNLPNATAACSGGACGVTACAAGYRDCDGAAANGCEVNTQSDNANCGACNNACAVGQVCSAGACVTTCASPLTLCSSGCSNTSSDPAHCGSCATACAAAANAVPVCAAGACAVVCMAGFSDCDRAAANGCEVDLTNGAANCGACGAACPARANASSVCASSACGFVCNAGFADCDGAAANGCEVSLATTTDCGTCAHACAALAGTAAVCIGGACGTACLPGYGDCDGNAANGCESTQSDPLNCGGCGVVCPAGRSCAAGNCLGATSCRAIKTALPASASGVYTIDPDGTGAGAPFAVYCEMDTDGGGWTVMTFIRANAGWDVPTFNDAGTVGDVDGGFAEGATLAASGATFTERIIIYRRLIELGSDLGQQWMETYRQDGVAVPYSSFNVNNGWGYRDSFGYADPTVNNACSHGCTTFRGLGMFHDFESGFGYAGTQGGDNGCRDGNNICWMPRSLGCNVGSDRCAYLAGTGEGVIYAGR